MKRFVLGSRFCLSHHYKVSLLRHQQVLVLISNAVTFHLTPGEYRRSFFRMSWSSSRTSLARRAQQNLKYETLREALYR